MENKDVVLCVESLISSSPQCRICHEEEEEEEVGSLEAPCACSGTVKFAHRECIQKWCNEKGNTICEICLQKFESGYTVPVKKSLGDVEVTIRGSLEVPRENQDYHNPGLMAIVAVDDEADYSECSFAAERGANCCRSVAVTFTMLFLVKHLLAVITTGTDQYAFTLLTLFVLRAGGILLPLYVMIQIINAVQNSLQRLYDEQEDDSSSQSDEEDEEAVLHPTVQIQT